jgi:hypothetical protein
MKRWFTYIVLLASVAAGCSSGPKHLSATDFQQWYLAGMGSSIVGYSYLRETNGATYMLESRVPLLFGSKPHEKTFFTETDGLDAEFLERMRRDSKLIEQWLKESRVEP